MRPRIGLLGIMAAVYLSCASSLYAQINSVSEKFIIDSSVADTWISGDTNILELQGPVRIVMDNMRLHADQAVVWLTPQPGALLGEQQAQIVLIGNASLVSDENSITRSGPRLLVSATVRGILRFSADRRDNFDDSLSDLYHQADSIRQMGPAAEALGIVTPPPVSPLLEAPPKGTPPGIILPPTVSKSGLVNLHAGVAQQLVLTDDDVVIVATGGLTVTQSKPTGDFLELLAQRAVLFTDLKGEDLRRGISTTDVGQRITAAYLEGDVRINYTPTGFRKVEQRLTADKVYYEFASDRAILSDVVMHTVDPRTQIPIIVRAQMMHQLAQGEYTAQKATMTTSSFATPSVSVRASDIYVHQVPGPDGLVNNDFTANDATLNLFGIPVFYLPVISGSLSNNPFPLRELSTGNTTKFGFGLTSQWGLFESLGRRPPQDMDISYRLDYLSKRGFGGGFDGNYQGGFIDESSLTPWDFQGDFKAYLIDDRGIDQLGGARADVTPPTDTRGRFLWEHTHFFPDDWEVQIRAGYVSDPTFLEEYYQPEFDDGLPSDLSFYVKQQKDDEALTFLGETDTTNFVTNAGQQPEQFDVQRTPEIGYQRIGDSILDDQATFFSQNTASGLRFEQSHASLEAQGYYPGLSPGIPDAGYTGTTGATVWRGDTRQELDWPLAVGQVKVVPYVMGRVTTYSNSPGGDPQTRLFTGGGIRMSTAFWQVDNSAQSDLLDIHRIRTIIEPEVNLFGSGSTVDQSKLYIYDPNVDAINDIQAAQLALHERWQTMRGGPAGWRSADLLEVNVEGNFFANQPPPNILNPTQFRGLYFPSDPEASIPRQGINADATYHVSDTTSILADDEWNMDDHELATAAIGLAAWRGDQLSYYLEDRYIQVLHSQVISFSSQYQLTRKYTLQFAQSFNFGDTNDINSVLTVIRQFDTFSVAVTVFHDAITGQSGFNLNLIPLGLPGPRGGLSGLVTPQ
jgi:hypothetical protein